MSRKAEKLTTMEDIATAAGVHRTTVSLALRGHPRIPAATRERIRAIAKRLRYTPNPLVSVLMSYRAGHRRPNWKAKLGWITSHRTSERRERSAYEQMYRGACERAEALGYELESFWGGDPGMSSGRFDRMLKTRNIPGLIIAPGPLKNRFSEVMAPGLDWSAFSAVTIGYSFATPDLHRITHDYFQSMLTIYEECLRLGYRRIGLVLFQESSDKVCRLWLSAYLIQQRTHPESAPLEPLLLERKGWINATEAWHRTWKPEVLIMLPHGYAQLLRGDIKGINTLPWINLACYDRSGEAAGIYQNFELIGATAVDYVSAMINQGQRGVPEQRRVLQIKGVWVPGKAAPKPRMRVPRTAPMKRKD
ncbi:MAG TPA: LacI family DNA-binding transcriptional regulator [Chthoniobacteraceae bacterium]|nr:LacI family DNA-binding transcriptional regulator [Chthoniobacteraceae bacterium]